MAYPRFTYPCGFFFATLLVLCTAGCGSESSQSFGSGGSTNNAPAVQPKGGSGNEVTSTGGASSGAKPTPTGTTVPSGGNSATTIGTTSPASNVVEPTDTYKTDCAEESCKEADGESCYTDCVYGSCCVHACEGQTGTNSVEVTCCDRAGAIVPGASCAQ